MPSAFFKSTNPDTLRRVGFKLVKGGAHTSRTMMLVELEKLFRAVRPEATAEEYAEAVVDENALGKETVSTRRKPAAPDKAFLREFQSLSGNAQLLRIHSQKEALTTAVTTWKKIAEGVTKRWPAWERLQSLHGLAATLPEAATVGASIAAIVSDRSLLSDPDPVPELAKQLTQALRSALGGVQDRLDAAFTAGQANLKGSTLWSRLSDQQRATLTATYQLAPSGRDPGGTEAEIIAALEARSLTDRHNLLDAIPQRFARALEEAGRLLEPKAQRVVLPGATLKTAEDFETWLQDVRRVVESKLKDGPVIL